MHRWSPVELLRVGVVVEDWEGIVGDALDLFFDAFSITPIQHCYPRWLDLDHPKVVRPSRRIQIGGSPMFKQRAVFKRRSLGAMPAPTTHQLVKPLSAMLCDGRVLYGQWHHSLERLAPLIQEGVETRNRGVAWFHRLLLGHPVAHGNVGEQLVSVIKSLLLTRGSPMLEEIF